MHAPRKDTFSVSCCECQSAQMPDVASFAFSHAELYSLRRVSFASLASFAASSATRFASSDAKSQSEISSI